MKINQKISTFFFYKKIVFDLSNSIERIEFIEVTMLDLFCRINLIELIEFIQRIEFIEFTV